jgi:hypothetical protein
MVTGIAKSLIESLGREQDAIETPDPFIHLSALAQLDVASLGTRKNELKFIYGSRNPMVSWQQRTPG